MWVCSRLTRAGTRSGAPDAAKASASDRSSRDRRGQALSYTDVDDASDSRSVRRQHRLPDAERKSIRSHRARPNTSFAESQEPTLSPTSYRPQPARTLTASSPGTGGLPPRSTPARRSRAAVYGGSASKISLIEPTHAWSRCASKPASSARAPARSSGCTFSHASTKGPISQAHTVP